MPALRNTLFFFSYLTVSGIQDAYGKSEPNFFLMLLVIFLHSHFKNV